jgi:hypothetical protein
MSWNNSYREWYKSVYLHSEHWQSYRIRELQRANFSCETCHRDNTPLHVHHLNYKRLWGEIPGVDTTVLCETCHSAQHPERYNLTWQQLRERNNKGSS